MPRMQTTVKFEFAEEITPDIVAAALDVEQEAARELCGGKLAFKQDELRQIAKYMKVAFKRLIKEKD